MSQAIKGLASDDFRWPVIEVIFVSDLVFNFVLSLAAPPENRLTDRSPRSGFQGFVDCVPHWDAVRNFREKALIVRGAGTFERGAKSWRGHERQQWFATPVRFDESFAADRTLAMERLRTAGWNRAPRTERNLRRCGSFPVRLVSRLRDGYLGSEKTVDSTRTISLSDHFRFGVSGFRFSLPEAPGVVWNDRWDLICRPPAGFEFAVRISGSAFRRSGGTSVGDFARRSSPARPEARRGVVAPADRFGLVPAGRRRRRLARQVSGFLAPRLLNPGRRPGLLNLRG